MNFPIVRIIVSLFSIEAFGAESSSLEVCEFLRQNRAKASIAQLKLAKDIPIIASANDAHCYLGDLSATGSFPLPATVAMCDQAYVNANGVDLDCIWNGHTSSYSLSKLSENSLSVSTCGGQFDQRLNISGDPVLIKMRPGKSLFRTCELTTPYGTEICRQVNITNKTITCELDSNNLDAKIEFPIRAYLSEIFKAKMTGATVTCGKGRRILYSKNGLSTLFEFKNGWALNRYMASAKEFHGTFNFEELENQTPVRTNTFKSNGRLKSSTGTTLTSQSVQTKKLRGEYYPNLQLLDACCNDKQCSEQLSKPGGPAATGDRFIENGTR